MKPLRLSLLTAIVLLAMPSAALAVSGTVYPAGDTFALGSQSVTVQVPFFGGALPATCTLNGGSATVPNAPNNSNPSGSVAVPFTTTPTYSGCTALGMAVTITTSGSWTLNLSSGFPAHVTSVSIPKSGFKVQVAGAGCSATSNAAQTGGNGSWQNGFATPVLVNSKLSLGAGPTLTHNGTGNCSGTMVPYTNTPVFEADDTTDPTDVILVGP